MSFFEIKSDIKRNLRHTFSVSIQLSYPRLESAHLRCTVQTAITVRWNVKIERTKRHKEIVDRKPDLTTL